MAFKSCTFCQKLWMTREDFISNRSISLIGYQACFDEPSEGVFLFTHTKSECGTTMAIPVAKFDDLYTGPRYAELNKGMDGCSKLCLDKMNFRTCSAPCSMAYIREIMNMILRLGFDRTRALNLPGDEINISL